MKEVFDAIDQYALAYGRLERLQRNQPLLLPIGDQKTGVIAEFYARVFAGEEFPDAELDYGTSSQAAWDICVKRFGQPDHKIQVKAVSEHSKTSRVSPIHPGWNELYLIRLNERLRPQRFWTLLAESVDWSKETLRNKTIPRPGLPGSASFANAVDRSEELIDLVDRVAAEAADSVSEESP